MKQLWTRKGRRVMVGGEGGGAAGREGRKGERKEERERGFAM